MIFFRSLIFLTAIAFGVAHNNATASDKNENKNNLNSPKKGTSHKRTQRIIGQLASISHKQANPLSSANAAYMTYDESEQARAMAGASKVAQAVKTSKARKHRDSGKHHPYSSSPQASKQPVKTASGGKGSPLKWESPNSARPAKHSPRGSVKTLSGECQAYSIETPAQKTAPDSAQITRTPSFGEYVSYSTSTKQNLDEEEIYV